MTPLRAGMIFGLCLAVMIGGFAAASRPPTQPEPAASPAARAGATDQAPAPGPTAPAPATAEPNTPDAARPGAAAGLDFLNVKLEAPPELVEKEREAALVQEELRGMGLSDDAVGE